MNIEKPAFIRAACMTVALVLTVIVQGAWAQAPSPVEETMKRMLSAVQSSALDDFVAQADPQAKFGLSKQMHEINQELGPRLKQGYASTYWGSLNQEGYEVHVWRLQFRDGKDDYLLTMAIKDRKVAGMWVH